MKITVKFGRFTHRDAGFDGPGIYVVPTGEGIQTERFGSMSREEARTIAAIVLASRFSPMGEPAEEFGRRASAEYLRLS